MITWKEVIFGNGCAGYKTSHGSLEETLIWWKIKKMSWVVIGWSGRGMRNSSGLKWRKSLISLTLLKVVRRRTNIFGLLGAIVNKAPRGSTIAWIDYMLIKTSLALIRLVVGVESRLHLTLYQTITLSIVESSLIITDLIP